MDSYDGHFVPSESILMFKAQTLARARAQGGLLNGPSLAAVRCSRDDPSLAPIIQLYEKHEGDIEKIFAELGDNPGKALKYPPSDANEFAVKYVEGNYTYIDLKAVMKKAGLEYEDTPVGSGEVEQGGGHLGILRAKLNQPVSELSEEPPDPSLSNLARSQPREAAEGPGATLTAEKLKTKTQSDDGKKRAPSRQSSKATDLAAAPTSSTLPPSSAASTPRATEHYSGYYGGDHGVHCVNQSQLLESRRLTLKKRDRGVPISAQYPALPLPGPTDDETAPLIALWYEHDGDMANIFAELGESPRKALKHPPIDAMDFAEKFIAGKLTDYASPKVKPGFEEQLMAPDRNSTSLQALAAIFPSLPHEVLYAVLEASNGSLEGAVHILLESGANLFDDSDTTAVGAAAASPVSDSGSGGEEFGDVDAGLSAMQQQRLEQEQERAKRERRASIERHEQAPLAAAAATTPGAPPPRRQSQPAPPAVPASPPPPPPVAEEDFILAITVPMGSRPNALLKITTTIGTVHARVPPGVRPGQSFFIRMRRGSSQAESSTS